MPNALCLTAATVVEGTAPHITAITVPQTSPKYTILIVKTTPVREYKGHCFVYCPITVKPAIPDLYIFKPDGSGKDECELVPRAVISMREINDVSTMNLLIQNLVDLLIMYMFEKQKNGRIGQNVWLKSAELFALFNASLSGAVSTLYSLASGVRTKIQPYLTVKQDVYTVDKVREAADSYLRRYKALLSEDVIREATSSGAIFTKRFMEQYIKEYKNYLLLSASYDAARHSLV